MASTRALSSSERDWLGVRSYLQRHRYELAQRAAAEAPPGSAVAGTGLIGCDDWDPSVPIRVQGLSITFASEDGSSPDLEGLAGAVANTLPARPDGTRYSRYSGAVRELAAPAVFENRRTYRLTGADLGGDVPALAFGRGRYFDGIDTGEAAAHEYAASRLNGRPATLRTMIGDPRDLTRRPANLAITTLTLRLDRAAGKASFLLHWRDPAKVGHAGGMVQVIPVGIFQPSRDGEQHERHDFSLWRCMTREFAEELCGHSENYGTGNGPIDYESWAFARRLATGLADGQIRAWCLGLGADPLTYALDLLTVAVIDSDLYDELFGAGLQANTEGTILAARDFTTAAIEDAIADNPMQAAGAAVLRLAISRRDVLLA